MSATEIMILLIVGIVVVGPKRLPTMMRTAGKWISKMRRMSSDLRSQSGIDRIIREEGLEKEIRELRSLKESLSKQALLDSLVKAADSANAPIRSKFPLRPAVTGSLGAASGGKPALTATSSESSQAKTGDESGDPKADETTREDTTRDAATGASATESSSGVIAAAAAGAVALYKPAEGTVSRAAGVTRSPVTSARRPLTLPSPPRAPYRSMREREFPSCGPDHYDALPDDLADDEELAAQDLVPLDRAEERAESTA